MYASQIIAEPRLLEPVFLAEVTCPTKYIGDCYNFLNARRGCEIIPSYDTGE